MTQSLREEFEELVKLGEKATPGPWNIVEDAAGGKEEAWCYWHAVGPLSLMGKEATNDTRLIAALRNFLSRSEELRKALENDARYRWIRSTFNVPDPSDDPESPWAQAWDMMELGQVDGRIAAQLDDAIDAARKEKP